MKARSGTGLAMGGLWRSAGSVAERKGPRGAEKAADERSGCREASEVQECPEGSGDFGFAGARGQGVGRQEPRPGERKLAKTRITSAAGVGCVTLVGIESGRRSRDRLPGEAESRGANGATDLHCHADRVTELPGWWNLDASRRTDSQGARTYWRCFTAGYETNVAVARSREPRMTSRRRRRQKRSSEWTSKRHASV